MGFKKNNPGCNCCGTCEVCVDPFDLADGSDIGTDTVCGWTASTGSWDINSSKLRCTSAGIAVSSTTSGGNTLDIELYISHNTASSHVDIIICRLDNNNYFRARYTFAGASGTVKIEQVSGGSTTTINTKTSATLTAASTYTARLCRDEDGVMTAYLGGTPVVSGTAFIAAPGTGIALGCSGSGTATYDALTINKSYSATDTSCVECDRALSCSGGCTSDSGPSSFQVTMSGITNGTCTSCSSYNATFVTTLVSVSSAGGCTYRYVFPGTICGPNPGDIDQVQVGLPWAPGAQSIAVGPAINNGFQAYFGDITGPYACDTLSAFALTYAFSNGRCTASSGSCTITAL